WSSPTPLRSCPGGERPRAAGLRSVSPRVLEALQDLQRLEAGRIVGVALGVLSGGRARRARSRWLYFGVLVPLVPRRDRHRVDRGIDERSRCLQEIAQQAVVVRVGGVQLRWQHVVVRL